MLDVPKDLPDAGPMDNVPADNVVADNNTHVPSVINTNSSVHSPLVPADAESAGQRPFLVPVAAANTGQLSGPKAPDFQGKTMRAVMEEATALGIPVEFTGDGLVRAQFPAPGSILAPNESVQVQFGR
ncbi:MAG: PASTA domain-containing protein [Bryobacteraceae bacterium]